MIADKVIKSGIAALLASVFLACFAAAQEAHSDSVPTLNAEDLDPTIQRVDDARLDRALVAYEADERLQRDRPEFVPEDADPHPPETPPGSNPFIDAIVAFFRAIGPILGYGLIAIIALAILAGLYFMFGDGLTLRGRQKDKAAAPDISVVPDLRPERARAAALLEDADALAAQGRFAEAVHLLLFRSIDDIQEKHTGVVGRSLTSREIGALSVLPSAVRDALSPIIRIVERSFFGGRDVDASGWQEARASYQSFAFGGAWS